jgi:hypothetical protein
LPHWGIGVYGVTFANRYRLIVAGKSDERKPGDTVDIEFPSVIQGKDKNNKRQKRGKK